MKLQINMAHSETWGSRILGWYNILLLKSNNSFWVFFHRLSLISSYLQCLHFYRHQHIHMQSKWSTELQSIQKDIEFGWSSIVLYTASLGRDRKKRQSLWLFCYVIYCRTGCQLWMLQGLKRLNTSFGEASYVCIPGPLALNGNRLQFVMHTMSPQGFLFLWWVR